MSKARACVVSEPVDTAGLRLAATTDPNVIAPVDLLRWALDAGWMNRPVPAW